MPSTIRAYINPYFVGFAMAVLAAAVDWAKSVWALAWLLGFGLAALIGAMLIAGDEWRLHRKRPQPKDVRAYADRLQAAHGREALRINAEAICAARRAKDFDRYRFLKAVAGELCSRFFSGLPDNGRRFNLKSSCPKAPSRARGPANRGRRP
jgi:hypothetical protein